MRESLSVKLASPLGILALSMLFWLVCLAMPFNTYTIHVEPAAVILLLGYLASIIAGSLVIRQRKNATIVPRRIDPRKLQVGYTVVLCMAAAGLMLKAYSVFFVDRFLSFDSVAAYRLAKMGTDETSTPLSQLATGVFPIALFAFMTSPGRLDTETESASPFGSSSFCSSACSSPAAEERRSPLPW